MVVERTRASLVMERTMSMMVLVSWISEIFTTQDAFSFGTGPFDGVYITESNATTAD